MTRQSMSVYLPVAETSVDIFLLLAIGAGVGILSGIFGVGGGFLLTPLLIFLGVPPPIAVASSANQLLGASVSGVLAHWRRGNVDFKMGFVLLVGGIAGSVLGVWLFALLKQSGQIDLAISLLYALLLSSLGALMLYESVLSIVRQRRPGGLRRKLHQHTWLHGLPLKIRFRRSRLFISALLPVGLGFIIGVLGAVLGIGGGFVMIPAMIYVLGMPTALVPGTSLFQIIFVAGNVTFLQAFMNHNVDIVLALLLLIGGVLGAQIGMRFGTRLRGEQLRFLLAVLVLAVAAKLIFDLTVRPATLFTVTEVVETLKARQIALVSLEEKIDTTSAAGELVFHVFGAIAQFERRLIAERTHDGVAAARAEGRHPGRPKLNQEKLRAALTLIRNGMSPTKAASHVGLGRSTPLPRARAHIRRTARSGLAGVVGQRTSEPLVDSRAPPRSMPASGGGRIFCARRAPAW